MPPVTQQSSRAGLITAVVIFTILFVTATIFAIYFNAEMRNTQVLNTDMEKKYQDIVSVSGLTSEEVTNLKALRDDANNAFSLQHSMKVLDAAFKQRNDLVKLITGKEATAGDAAGEAYRQAVATLAEVAKKAGGTVPADNLLGALNGVAANLDSARTAIITLTRQADDSAKQAKDAIAKSDAEVATMQKEMAKVQKDATQAIADAAGDRQAKQAQIDQLEAGRQAERTAAIEKVNQKDVEIKQALAKAADADKQLFAARERLGGTRVRVEEPIVRQGDGQIVRLPGNNVVYINRGVGDQIVPGMTFEVYDKNEGIPKLGDGLSDENMPVGKASLEVIRVGAANLSECRIVKQQPGATLTEGDLIMNLVYDPAIKYNFAVHGKFDLDQNGLATPDDAAIIKRLITQWGAKVTDRLNVDTDFLVMGKEPVLDSYSEEELKDPLNAQKLADATKELNEYQDVLKRASELHIPVLNQNRFLYFIGYYDLAKR